MGGKCPSANTCPLSPFVAVSLAFALIMGQDGGMPGSYLSSLKYPVESDFKLPKG